MQNFVYVLQDDAGQAMLVDPAFEIDRVLRQVGELGVHVSHVLATHGHPDHVMGVPTARERLGAKVVAHESADHAPVDVRVKDLEGFSVGAMDVRVLHTPGHRFDSVCYVVADNRRAAGGDDAAPQRRVGDGTHILTGDTLFVGECGRVDLPGSDPVAMHKSLVTTLRALPDGLIVLPGHDYGPTPTSTLGEEKRTTHTMQPRTLDEFLAFMAEP